MRKFIPFVRAIRGELSQFVTGALLTLSGLIWTVAGWIKPSLRAPEFAPWMLYLPGIALLFYAAFAAWRKESDRGEELEKALFATVPKFMPIEYGIKHAELDPTVTGVDLASLDRYFIVAAFRIDADRRTAFGVTGRFLVTDHTLLNKPSIDHEIDNGYNESRDLNFKPSIRIPMNAPPHYIACELRYEDRETSKTFHQAWYWRWNGSNAQGLFHSDFGNVSKSDTDRLILYLKNLNINWGDSA